MSRKNNASIEIAERVYIKQRRNGRWFYYFSLDAHQFRGSTKTTDRYKATLVAIQLYHEAVDRKRWGISFDKISFVKLSRKYRDELLGEVSLRNLESLMPTKMALSIRVIPLLKI